MKRHALLLMFAAAGCLGFSSCADQQEKKPAGPVTQESQIPWNSPVAGQGQGQFGMLPQNQYRR